LARQVTTGSRVGWKSQARWTTASAPSKIGSRSGRSTSARCHSTPSSRVPGSRLATPTTEVTLSPARSARTTLVPTVPVAPTTATLMAVWLPRSAAVKPHPSGLEQDLDGAVPLLLEHLVRFGRPVERHRVRGEIHDPQRVGVVGDERHQRV